MLFRQLFDSDTSTYTYLLADEETHEAVIIDPVFEHERRDVALLREEAPEGLAVKASGGIRTLEEEQARRAPSSLSEPTDT